MKFVSFIMLVSFSLSMAFGYQAKIIYGDDNRVDVINSPSSFYTDLSLSTAAMVNNNKLKTSNNGAEIELSAKSLKEAFNVCSDERFAEQPTAARCSGFLVAEDLLVTAGHCVRSESDCSNHKWVFDYKIKQEGQTAVKVPVSSVYNCKKIINTVLAGNDDFALIQLDREVNDRNPLTFRKSGQPAIGDELVVIGHPSGLPTKIADGATVRKLEGKYFNANLDTYGGNSGSAVFNSNTGMVEGILVRGLTDYIYDSANKCRRSNVVSNENSRTESVTYITNIPELQD